MATGPAAFTITMQALGALHFFDALVDVKPAAAFGDPAGCLSQQYQQHSLHALVLRHLRCASGCSRCQCFTCTNVPLMSLSLQ